MNLQSITGNFESNDALYIIKQMINVKIKFHEDKIDNSFNEEDIKIRETKIKNLQASLHDIQNQFYKFGKKINLQPIVDIH